MERTFIMLKPEVVQRGLVGKFIKRFETRGYKLVAMKFMKASEDLLKQHYEDLAGKPYLSTLIKHIGSGPVVAMVWEGKDVVKQARQMLGETNPLASKPGSIRGDFAIDIGRNVIHGSSSVESAKKEINLWFKAEEVIDWTHCMQNEIYE